MSTAALRRSKFLHGHTSVLDYDIDWTDFLAATLSSDQDEIVLSDWTADDPGIAIGPAGGLPGPTEFTREVNGITRHYAKVWVGAADAGVEYVVTNRVTTLLGRTDEESIVLLAVDR